MVRRPVVSLAIVCSIVLAATPRVKSAEPDVPKEIAVPDGHKLLFKVEAKGMQVYKSVADESGKLKWFLEAPLADLFDSAGARAGFHYDGPSWEAKDGGKVVRDKSVDVKSAPAPKPEADIPWLLIKVKAENGTKGALSQVVYIQRLQTAGGKPPSDDPKRVGTKAGVGYTATYYFYAKAD
jgi:Protein of unknown function (DUF3455)